jgi:hypothetical protein
MTQEVTASHELALRTASGGAGHTGVLAAIVALAGLIAVFAWLLYRFGPTLSRVSGIAFWWAGWACGSQGGFGYMAFLLILGTLLWAAGTIWYARRRGHWPSPISARLLGRDLRRPTA